MVCLLCQRLELPINFLSAVRNETAVSYRYCLVLSAGWLVQTFQPALLDPKAVSRPVEARGDLASDEKNTIDIFRNAAPSVVYITSIAVRRNLFSLNVYEIPQGTGSGFIWDKQGRIVTNYHVISDASRLEVTLADRSLLEGGAGRRGPGPGSGGLADQCPGRQAAAHRPR